MSPEERKGNLKRIDSEIKMEQINLLALLKAKYMNFSQREKELTFEIIKVIH